jgi:ABC-type amino acid transport substrate-binding protein
MVGALLAGALASAMAQPVSMPLVEAAPFAWRDSEGLPQGIYPAVAAALAKETGLDIRVDIVPFARAANLVGSGQADATLLFATNATQDRTVEAAILFHTDQVVLLRPGLRVAARADLGPLLIARMNGGCRDLAEEITVPWRFEELSNQEAGIKLLLAGRIDGFCSVRASLQYAINSLGQQANMAAAQTWTLSSRPVWLHLSPKLAPAVADRLTRGVRQIQASGEVQRIFARILGPSYVLNLPK